MSIVLNGTSQYVSLGNAVDLRSTAPILFVAVVDTTGLPSGTRGLYSQGDYNANTGHGAFAYGSAPKLTGNYYAPSGIATRENDGTTITVPANDGWYLIAVSIFTTGIAPSIGMLSKTQNYSYTHTAWSAQESLGGEFGLSAVTTQAPTGSQTTVIGANYIGSIGNFWGTKYSWCAIFNHDGGAESTQIKDTSIAAELISNGFWNLLDSNCYGAWAFDSNTTDQSGRGHNGTLIGSPSYGTVGPNEANPSATDGLPMRRLRANAIPSGIWVPGMNTSGQQG